MRWVSLFLQMLPVIVTTVEKVGGHLAGHEKKEAVKDALNGVAAGVGTVMPEHALPASTAAAVASESIDGVVEVLNQAGVLNPHKAGTGAAVSPEVNAPNIPAAASAVPSEVSHLGPQ